MLFALKVIMSTVDHVETNVHKETMTSHRPYLKSRKEVPHRQALQHRRA